jgi:hypothetical protein
MAFPEKGGGILKMKVSYTIYAKPQPKPLVGDEHYPDGCVGLHIGPTPSITLTELKQLISDLQLIAEKMEG